MLNSIVWAELNENFKLAQRNDKFKFGTDAVLLSDFVSVKPKHNVVDLCAGTGAVGFLCFLRYKQKKTVFVEIDAEMTELSRITAEKNCVSDSFSHITCDIYKLDNSIIKNQWADYITVNPPYFLVNSGKINNNSDVTVARHCKNDFLDVLFKKSFSILKDGGKVAMVNRSEHLADIIFYMRKNGIEPKRLRNVHSYKNKNANLVLIEGIKNASPALIIESPLILYSDNGEYTEEFSNMQKL